MRTKHFSPHLRIILRKNHIWISEFLGILVVLLIIVALTTLGSIVRRNYLTLRKNHILLLQSSNQDILSAYTRKELKKKVIISNALTNCTRKDLPQNVLSSVTEIVYQNSKTFGYDPLLVLAVIHVESWFDPEAKGQYRDGRYSGAFGLMQLKVATAREVAKRLDITFNGEKDLYNPAINIPLGVAYLTQQISKFKNLKFGILAYNQGPGTIRSDLRNKRPLSIRYYNKVLKSYYHLKEKSGSSSIN